MILTTTNCKTRQTSQHLRYDSQVTIDSVAIKNNDVRDFSVTDVTIVEFDTVGVTGTGSLDPSLRLGEMGRFFDPLRVDQRTVPFPPVLPKKITLIHRQNNIQSIETDSIQKSEQSEQTTTITQQNKSSPDKSSQILAITISIIILLIIVVIFILILKR